MWDALTSPNRADQSVLGKRREAPSFVAVHTSSEELLTLGGGAMK
jgi:hypothetical protein